MDCQCLTEKEKRKRHDITKIPEFLPIIKNRFGKEGVEEYLYHIKEDYENSRSNRLIKIIGKIKFWSRV